MKDSERRRFFGALLKGRDLSEASKLLQRREEIVSNGKENGEE